jgi:hypothetical protein
LEVARKLFEIPRFSRVFDGFCVGMLWDTLRRFVSEADAIASGSTGFHEFEGLRFESWI